MHYVYKMIDQNDQVVYIGESKDPKFRFRSHTFYNKTGPFYNHNLKLEIVTGFPIRKDAWRFQCDLQKSYNLQTDLDKNKSNARKSNAQSRAGKIGNITTNSIKVTCPHCGKVTTPGPLSTHIKHKHA